MAFLIDVNLVFPISSLYQIDLLMLIRKSAPLRKLNIELHLNFVSKLLIDEIDTVFKAL